MNFHIIIPRLIGMVMSWIQAGDLRNRMYKMAEEAELMMTGLEDIERMDRGGKLGEYAGRVIRQVKNLPLDEKAK